MIKDISDKRRLPRLGKIRLGEKAISGKGKEYPKALDYFNCPEEVRAIYGDEPRELRVMFPVEDTETIFPQWLKRYGSGSGLVCIGNGETATEYDPESGEGHEIECPYEECPAYQKKHCRRVASLQFMLPEVPGFGVWQIDTTSYHSIVNLNSCFDMIRGICGRIAGIPLTLKLEPKEVRGGGSKKVVHVLNLSSPLTLAEMLEQRGEHLQLEAPKPSHECPTDLYPGKARPGPEEQKEKPGAYYADDTEVKALYTLLGLSGARLDSLFARFDGKRDEFLEYLRETIQKELASNAGNAKSDKPEKPEPRSFF